MSWRPTRPLVPLVLSWALGCASAPTPHNPAATRPGSSSAAETPASQRIDDYVGQFGRHWGEAFRFNGYVMVVRDGEVLYSNGFGRADAAGSPFEATTVFPIASNTKAFTAAAILKLQERQKLSVEDRVVDHLPDYEGPAAEVTIHQLLTHTAGLPSYTTFPKYFETQSRERSVEEILDLFRARPLLFSPGESYTYSNSGYALLGAIIEAASGSSYGEFLASEIIASAGLQDTSFVPAGYCQDELPGYALGDDERLKLDDQNTHMSNGFSAGGIRSTATDLAAWGTALLDGRVLQASSMEALFTAEREHYAYGWEIGELAGQPLFWHGGVICGFQNQVVLLPEEKLVVVAWINNRDFALDPLVPGVVSLALGEEPLPVEEPALVELSEAQRKRIAGQYQITDQGRTAAIEAGAPETWIDTVSALTLVDRGGELYVENLGGLLSATEDGPLVVRSWRVFFTFERDDTDRITGMWMRQGDTSIEYDRAPAADEP
ncbi:MAG: serine hydrolase domain-containing protein [Myxococcota bacterium]